MPAAEKALRWAWNPPTYQSLVNVLDRQHHLDVIASQDDAGLVVLSVEPNNTPSSLPKVTSLMLQNFTVEGVKPKDLAWLGTHVLPTEGWGKLNPSHWPVLNRKRIKRIETQLQQGLWMVGVSVLGYGKANTQTTQPDTLSEGKENTQAVILPIPKHKGVANPSGPAAPRPVVDGQGGFEPV